MMHIGQINPEDAYFLSRFGSVAASPPRRAIKGLKQYVCWTYDRREQEHHFGGHGAESLDQPPIAEIEAMLQAPKLTLPHSLIVFVDADLHVQSRYCVYVFLNHGCVFGTSRLQHSIAVDITASEAFGFSIAAIMAEIIRGYMEDLGMASATAQAAPIVTDNDATMRIASDAASAKRALHILRRLAHARELKTRGEVAALHVPGVRNPANIGTKYVTAAEFLTAARLLQNS